MFLISCSSSGSGNDAGLDLADQPDAALDLAQDPLEQGDLGELDSEQDPPDLAEDLPVDGEAGDTLSDLVGDRDVTEAATDQTEEVQPPPRFPVCNLLVNGDAETGDITGWVVDLGEFEAIEEDPDRFPPAYQGSRLFFAGETGESQMSQTIDLSEWEADIDNGDLWFRFGGQVRDWVGQDQVVLGLELFDAGGESLGQILSEPYAHSYWRHRQVASLLPAGTRQVQVLVRALRVYGDDNDGYLDGLSGCLDTSPPADLDALTLAPYLMWVTTDAISLSWESAQPTASRVDYGPGGSLVHQQSSDLVDTFHQLRLSGLTPDSEYSYRVSWGDGYWTTHRFHTAPVEPRPISFVVWGDNQDGPDTFQRLIREMAARQPDFALSVGDTVQAGTVDNYHNQLWGPSAPLTQQVPLLIAHGNHERYEDELAELFDHYVAQPGDEHCFGWSYGPLYFVFLDTERPIYTGSPEYTCIEGLLSSEAYAASSLQIALFHKPPRIEYWAGDSCDSGDFFVRYFLEPLFTTYGLDLVFSGHAHLYSFTPPVGGEGPTWVTTGGGGGGLDRAEDHCYTWEEITVTHHEHHYLYATFQDGTLTVQAVTGDGAILHSFALEGD